MSNLSLTACSFFFRKYNTKKSDYIFNLNESITITDNNDNQHKLKNCFDLFNMFFNNYNHMYKDDDKSKRLNVILNQQTLLKQTSLQCIM